jgi:aryl-alcohol dehydrogenase-like predicted oxidoreductase
MDPRDPSSAIASGIVLTARSLVTEDERQQLEDSLRALQTDHVDHYHFTPAAMTRSTSRALEMLNEQVRAGRSATRLSISPNSQRVPGAAGGGGWRRSDPVVYNRLDRTPEAELLPVCQEDDLGVLARVPLASGLLSGKYRPATGSPRRRTCVRARETSACTRDLAEVERASARWKCRPASTIWRPGRWRGGLMHPLL